MAQFNRQRTSLDIAKRVCGQLGLPLPQTIVSDPSNRMAVQMLYLLNEVGERLVRPHQGYRWQVLKRTWSLTTVPGQTQYTLPADWDSFIDDTAWSGGFPMVGPASDQQWSALKGSLAGPTTIHLFYRVRGDKFEVYYSPTTSQT